MTSFISFFIVSVYRIWWIFKIYKPKIITYRQQINSYFLCQIYRQFSNFNYLSQDLYISFLSVTLEWTQHMETDGRVEVNEDIIWAIALLKMQ